MNIAHPNLEIVGVQIYVPDPLNFACVYRPPPGCNKSKFISNLSKVFNDICDVPTCLVGDFNEDFLDTKQDHNIHKTLTNAGSNQHVKVPTTDSGTLLDHVCILHIWDMKTEVSDCYYSDHDIVFQSIQI